LLKKRIIFIVGPTASGKSAVAYCLAKKINGEIVCCDSMQVYQGMNILNSAPEDKFKRQVKHHLFEQVPVTCEYDVSRYRKQANAAIIDIFSRGKTPILVGGTGLYMSILLDGIFEVKIPEQEKIRSRLYKLSQDKGKEYLYQILLKTDKEAAAKIHPHDLKRVIRALEVFLGTGKKISFLQKQRSGLADSYDIKAFCLNMDRKDLYSRIDKRVNKMQKSGLLKEVKDLLKKKTSRTASFAIGISEIGSYLKDECLLEEALERIKHNTRLYAKRQLTWFRKDKRLCWIEIKAKDKPSAISKLIANRLES
jgi:tRNA dimethylallyltransferase